MSDFFGALELELRHAAERRPRRPVGVGQVIGIAGAAALVAVALALTMTVRGGGDDGSGRLTGAREPDPVGTVIPKTEDGPYESRALVVANGEAPVAGPWQIEVSRTKGSRAPDGTILWRRGYCLWLHLVDPPARTWGRRGGFCGSPRSLGFRKTPGFNRAQNELMPVKPRPREILVWGRVPDRAEQVVITAPDGLRIARRPKDGPESFPGRYYGIPVSPGHPGARINWLDARGEPGSRGIRLMPPITPQKRRP